MKIALFLTFALISQLAITIDITKNHFEYATAMKPHPDKEFKGGEDAYYANENLLSVADGVGGWANHGIDPGLYSKALCQEIGKFYNKNPSSYTTNPKKLIADAWALDEHIGSSTVVVGILDPVKPIFRTSYVGDSGYYIIRKSGMRWTFFFMSEEQQKGFNFPYQLAFSREHGDHPDVAVKFEHQVKDGDIVIVGSDGLFDNLFPSQIMNIMRGYLGTGDRITDVKKLAVHLMNEAFRYSVDMNWESPFKRKAEENGYMYQGGKSDDITVVVGQVWLANSRKPDVEL
jgi:protein phosphatase PTC7